ncbi:NfeD family protein [Anaerocolumna aminovalerica]|jgi:membrane protein implicated in regulation of membrane protease activity|uniref:Membrane protein implicated in regulation of membrane protease activity n=1 Tax=Anaerocolumna aminovalerica TaxID=1527 RepID=A0A1I5H0W7_9FIRM|nr:NfeD family protein [Anaerocolumna aminovalerica]MBU5332811.1 NfeD family protein [Anaerocolumna aminovalerica]MDU6266515.1 NfeD family protein [Anaerocolumna aminovalerica]SFO41666.1 Membrane protein implicated in regulation of membrane protease activity [Anaerocolumna aminovalerica]
MDSMYWLVILAIFLLIEIITLGLTTIWFAGGSLVSFFLSLLVDNMILEITVCLVVSFLLLFFTRPVAKKYFNKQRVKTNIDLLIGKEVKVIETIDNLNGKGWVLLNGQEWMARAVNDDTIIPEGERVIVRKVSGVKLIVDIKEEI